MATSWRARCARPAPPQLPCRHPPPPPPPPVKRRPRPGPPSASRPPLRPALPPTPSPLPSSAPARSPALHPGGGRHCADHAGPARHAEDAAGRKRRHRADQRRQRHPARDRRQPPRRQVHHRAEPHAGRGGADGRWGWPLRAGRCGWKLAQRLAARRHAQDPAHCVAASGGAGQLAATAAAARSCSGPTPPALRHLPTTANSTHRWATAPPA